MDNLILAGIFSIAALFVAAILIIAAGIFALAELSAAVAAGNTVRAAAVPAILLLLLAAYAGTGLWLQKTGRI